MPPTIQRKSYDSVTVFWLDKEILQRKIRDAVRALVDSRPEVQEVILFGSVAQDRAAPGSDVDILIIARTVTGSYLERPAPYLSYFSDLGVGTDVFVYTVDESIDDRIPLLRTARASGRVLFER